MGLIFGWQIDYKTIHAYAIKNDIDVCELDYIIETEKKIKYNKEIERLSLTEAQAEISKKIVNNFPSVTFVGKTNKGNLVFENKNKQLKVSPKGNIL